MLVTKEDNEEIDILGLLFSDYDFFSLIKMKSKSSNIEEYESFLIKIFKKIDLEYSLIQDEEKKKQIEEKINNIVLNLNLENLEIDLNNYSWYRNINIKKLNLKK